MQQKNTTSIVKLPHIISEHSKPIINIYHKNDISSYVFSWHYNIYLYYIIITWKVSSTFDFTLSWEVCKLSKAFSNLTGKVETFFITFLLSCIKYSNSVPYFL